MSDEKNTFGSDAQRMRGNNHPHTSHDSARECDSQFSEQTVLECIQKKGSEGAIQDDVLCEIERRNELGECTLRIDSISPRFIALLEKCYIRRGPATRKGYRTEGSKQQLVMYALSPEERQQRLDSIAAITRGVLTDEQHKAITEWWRADAALTLAAYNEGVARRKVHEVVLLGIPSGVVKIPLGRGFKLRGKVAEGFLRFLQVREPKKK